MLPVKFFFLALATVVCAYHKHGGPQQENNLLASTPLGKIQGATLTSRLGKTIYAFRGIRYGQPPIGELRFKPPVPVGKWNGTYDATKDGPSCPQLGVQPVSEDCLFLNVYTTKLPDASDNPKRPVIIHLHPGGFSGGVGRSSWAGPQYLLDHDIIFVTLNYRLSSLGFLSVGKESPGNNGLKDQVLAMKWVKQNIESFGGDTDSITLYGYSAGATSVVLHMVSPMSRGLFHRAIASSSSPFKSTPLPKNQLELAKREARLFGCPDTTTSKAIIECFKNVPAKDLGDSLVSMQEFGNDPVTIWSPVVEEDYGQERFLPDDPVKLIKSGNFMQVPLIAGITKDEFGHRAYNLVRNSTLLNELSDNFEKYAPISFAYERDTEKSREASRKLRKFYLGDGPLTNASFPGLAKLYEDALTGSAVNREVKLISEYSSAPVYYYRFSYQGRYSYFYVPGSNGTVPYGVVHHDDLMYVFYMSTRFPFFNSTDPETFMVKRLTLMWTNFAKTGNPIANSAAELDNAHWEPFKLTTQKYLDIGEKLVLKERLYKERYDFYLGVLPLAWNP